MAKSIQGFGTTFYGKRDFRSDGTYITTKWFILFFIPIIPIRSFRVRYQGHSSKMEGLSAKSSERYVIYEETTPNWKQGFFTYGFMCFFFLWGMYFTPWLLFKCKLSYLISDTMIPYLLMLFIFMPSIIPYLLRRNARQRFRA